MRRKGWCILFMMGVFLCGLTACTNRNDTVYAASAPLPETDAETATEEESLPAYEQISAEEAKKLMDTETDYIIVDVRTKDEFTEGHIDGAILIPYSEITDRAKEELPDQEQLILIYCRSGRRSKIASEALAELGYTNVKEFGGIIDWPYDLVKE